MLGKILDKIGKWKWTKPLVFSVLAHAGGAVLFADDCKPQGIVQQAHAAYTSPAEAPAPPPLPPDKKKTLEDLLEEQKEFNKELYEHVKTGELQGMEFHEAVLKASVTDHNILLAKAGRDDYLSYEETLREFIDFNESIRPEVEKQKTAIDKIDTIQMLHYDKGKLKGYQSNKYLLTFADEEGRFNCVSATLRITASAMYFGLDNQRPLYFSNHRKSIATENGRVWEYEHTSRNRFRSRYRRSKKKFPAPAAFPLIEYLLGKGYPLSMFPPSITRTVKHLAALENSKDTRPPPHVVLYQPEPRPEDKTPLADPEDADPQTASQGSADPWKKDEKKEDKNSIEKFTKASKKLKKRLRERFNNKFAGNLINELRKGKPRTRTYKHMFSRNLNRPSELLRQARIDQYLGQDFRPVNTDDNTTLYLPRFSTEFDWLKIALDIVKHKVDRLDQFHTALYLDTLANAHLPTREVQQRQSKAMAAYHNYVLNFSKYYELFNNDQKRQAVTALAKTGDPRVYDIIKGLRKKFENEMDEILRKNQEARMISNGHVKILKEKSRLLILP
jgi:hypothetical protein